MKIERIPTGNRVPTPPSRLDTEMFHALEAGEQSAVPGLDDAADDAYRLDRLRPTARERSAVLWDRSAGADDDRTHIAGTAMWSDCRKLRSTSLSEYTFDAVTEVAAKK